VVDVIKDSGEKICRPGEVGKEVAIKQHSGRFGSTEASIDTGAGSGGMAGAGGAGLELKRCTMQDGGNPLKICQDVLRQANKHQEIFGAKMPQFKEPDKVIPGPSAVNSAGTSRGQATPIRWFMPWYRREQRRGNRDLWHQLSAATPRDRMRLPRDG
jgi:hypothetical protein